MNAQVMAYLIIFSIVIASEIFFTLLFILFVNKFIQDPQKRKNTIIRYVFVTIFMTLGLLAGFFSHS